MRLIVAALAACVLLSAPVAAKGKPATYDLTVWGGENTRVVEQQSVTACFWPTQANPYPGDENCVLNQTECFWDVDDHGSAMGYGRLFAGTSSASRCGVIDFDPRMFAVSLYSTRADLDVRLAIDPGLTFRIAPAASDKPDWPWRYYGCLLLSHTEPVSTITEEILDSNGGRGVITWATFSVTSPADQKANQTTSGGAFHARDTSGRIDSYCYDPSQSPFYGQGDITGGGAYGPGGGQHRYSFTPGSEILP